MLNQLMPHDPNWASHLHTILTLQNYQPEGTLNSASPFAQKLILLVIALASLSIHPVLQCPVLTFLNHQGQALAWALKSQARQFFCSRKQDLNLICTFLSIPSFLELNYCLLSLQLLWSPHQSWFDPHTSPVGLFFPNMRDAFLISCPVVFVFVLYQFLF